MFFTKRYWKWLLRRPTDLILQAFTLTGFIFVLVQMLNGGIEDSPYWIWFIGLAIILSAFIAMVLQPYTIYKGLVDQGYNI